MRRIADHGGYDQKSVTAQIQTQRYQQAWRQMRRSARLYGLFVAKSESSKAVQPGRSDYGPGAMVVFKPS